MVKWGLMGKKKRVAVLMGGRTPEHEISLISGREVVKNLPTAKYQAIPLVISRDGATWEVVGKRGFLRAAGFTSQRPEKEWQFPKSKNLAGFADFKKLAEVVFIAMHGPFGEDGTVQGMLELLGIPYCGSGVLASSVGMNKLLFRKIMQQERILVPKFVAVREDDPFWKIYKKLGRLPYFVKPSDQGSSVGMSIVRKKKDLKRALKKAFKFGPVVLVDEYIEGLEVTCGILGEEALPLIEIIPGNEFFDYQAKYEEVGTQEIVPARISKKLTKRIQEIALRVYQTIGCRGFSRVDFILKNRREPVLLEINTIPGLTPMSLLPKAAKAAGYSYSQMLDKIVRLALE